MYRALFGDTYIKKHYDCALPLVNALLAKGVAPILTQTRELPKGIDCDCLIYFNRPACEPLAEYQDKPRILIDHGASNLKWFLASERRFNFFDLVLTAGPDHVKSLLSFFPDAPSDKVRSVGFVKSSDLHAPAGLPREEVCRKYSLSPNLPIVLFAPTWHISANRDMEDAIASVADIPNHVACLHPETAHLKTSGLNIADNVAGTITELIKHSDCVISDTSSTLFEAAALGKRVVQVALREYSDNNSVLFDYPYTAGMAQLFCAGAFCRPHQVALEVSRALELPPAHFSPWHARVLSGTLIDLEVDERIANEIVRCCEELQLRRGDIKAQLIDVKDNLFFAQQRIIAHGCGDFAGLHASNSREAFGAAMDAVDMVELDVVEAADGLVVAHDGFEARYGINGSFGDVTMEQFQTARFGGKLTPLSLQDALREASARNKGIVIDVKATGSRYRDVAFKLRDELEAAGGVSRAVIQCYCLADVEVALEAGFPRILLAVWKYYYKDPLGDEAFAFLERSVTAHGDSIVAISVPYTNKHMQGACVEDPRFERLGSLWKRVFVHGAPKGEYSGLMKHNLGVFADGFADGLDFSAAPSGFNWREYLFLNPDIINAGYADPISSVVHFLKYGRKEGRLARYEVPKGFNYAEYVDMNPDLRKGGISGVDTGKAHWTRYGVNEGRKYTRGSA